MTATYTFDVFSSLDGYGAASGDWSGYWGKQGPDWPDATLVSGDAVEVVARLKEESDVPLRSHGSLSMNRALMAAGLVDQVQVTLFPVITGRTGVAPIFRGPADFDLELVGSRTLDRDIQELVYRPTLHG
jgi:dihydrofolate reductase